MKKGSHKMTEEDFKKHLRKVNNVKREKKGLDGSIINVNREIDYPEITVYKCTNSFGTSLIDITQTSLLSPQRKQKVKLKEVGPNGKERYYIF